MAQSKAINDFDLKATLDLLKRDVMLSLNCHSLGTVQSFDPDTQTAQISVNYKRTTYRSFAPGSTPEAVYTDYPILVDCPIVQLAGGAAGVQLPITAGDTCLILFNDRDIDNWFTNGQVQPLGSARLHSFTDAVGLVGLRHLGNVLDDYDLDHASLYWGTTRVAVSATKVLIENGTTDLKTVINDILDRLITIVGNIVPTTGMSSGNIAANTTALNLLKTEVASLLE